jgi:phosphoglycerol transferase MdoB-like AlkP superfamily enzyme
MQTPSLKSTRYPLPFIIFIAIIALAIWFLLRLTLLLDVGVAQLSFYQTMSMFSRGLWFDINALCFFMAPWLVISALLPNSLRTKAWLNNTRWVLAFFIIFGLLFGAVSEVIFWQEFTTRFNFIAVDYLIYTNEVIGNIRESYPVPLILLGLAAITFLILWLARQCITLKTNKQSAKKKWILLVAAILLPIISFQLGDIEQMDFSKNAYANELSGNGLFSFAAAARRNELDYDKFYKTIPQQQADAILAKNGLERQPLSHALASDKKLQEVLEIGSFTRHPKNVILITVESLSAEYLGSYGNKENLTPYLDQLATQSLVFDKIFATGTRTVRGLDALTLAIPPIPGQAIVHRPNNEHLATLGEMLEAQNFSTFFIYGGYGVFDNMNNYFRGNDYVVVDRTDFDAITIQTENVWGVDDESLFDNASMIFDKNVKTHKPFFAHIMTTSNHRPYTFPEGKIDLPQGHRSGAIKYTDYAIGQFIEKAKTRPWFKDTLFVIVADHCASVAGKTKLPVAKYHIPLIFYAPDMLPAGHYPRMASQIDIVPTLLDVLGAKGDDHFFGQSLFEEAKDQIIPRAFISNYQELGYYKNDTLIVLSPKEKAEAYKVSPVTMESTPTGMDQTMLNEAIAYYQTASRAFKTGALKESENLN